MGICASSTAGVETEHHSPTTSPRKTNKNNAQQLQKMKDGGTSTAVTAAVARTFLNNPANPQNIKMVAVNRQVDEREEAAIRAIFSSLDKDQSQDVSNDELSFLFSNFGFELDRLAIEHVGDYLRTNGEECLNEKAGKRNGKGKDERQMPPAEPLGAAKNPLLASGGDGLELGGGKGKIDVNAFLAHWPSLLNFCERMVAAVHNKPILTNPQHRGDAFEALLGPFVDAGFGEGKVLKVPSDGNGRGRSQKGKENEGKEGPQSPVYSSLSSSSSDKEMHALIDRITELCYEKGVLFRDAFFEPTLENVASHSSKRSTFSRWARISELSNAFASAAIAGSSSSETMSAAEKRKNQLIEQMTARLEKEEKERAGGRNGGNSLSVATLSGAVLDSMQQFSASAFSPVTPCMYIQGTQASDVINNNWSGSKNRYAAGIASLADRFDLLRPAIYPPRYNPAGIYGVKVNRGGEWYWVIVDDYIPVDDRSVPLYLRSKTPNEIWPLIIDKAFAKIKGSYEKLHNSQQSLLVDPLSLLAGLQPATFLINSSFSSPQALSASYRSQVNSGGGVNENNTFSSRCENVFELIRAYIDLKWFLVASPSSSASSTSTSARIQTPPPQGNVGSSVVGSNNHGNQPLLVLDNSYSILGYFEASSDDKENGMVTENNRKNDNVGCSSSFSSIIRLVKCRSPWGRLEWRGKWADTDTATWGQYPNLAKRLLRCIDDDEDGTFWIQVEDLVPRFDIIHCWGMLSKELVDVINNKSGNSGSESEKSINRENSPMAEESEVRPATSATTAKNTSHSLAQRHEAMAAKLDKIASLLPPTLKPFAPALNFATAQKCWHEAVEQINRKREFMRYYTEKQSFLLTHPFSQRQRKQLADVSNNNNNAGEGLFIAGEPVMTPFDCPQFRIRVLPGTAAVVEGTKDKESEEEQRFVTFYFRARRLLLSRGQRQQQQQTLKYAAVKSSRLQKTRTVVISEEGELVEEGEEDEGEDYHDPLQDGKVKIKAASVEDEDDDGGESDNEEHNLAFVQTEISKLFGAIQNNNNSDSNKSNNSDGTEKSCGLFTQSTLDAAVSGGFAAQADGNEQQKAAFQSVITNFFHDPNTAISSPQAFLVKSAATSSSLSSTRMKYLERSMMSSSVMAGSFQRDHQQLLKSIIRASNNNETGENSTQAAGGREGEEGEKAEELPATERLLTIPTGKAILAHSGGGYTRVTLPAGDYTLMMMASDCPNVPIKLTIRTKKSPSPMMTVGGEGMTAASTSSTNSPPSRRVLVTPIKRCEGVVYTSDLRAEALGDVIAHHTAYISVRDGLILPLSGTSTAGATAKSTTNMVTHKLTRSINQPSSPQTLLDADAEDDSNDDGRAKTAAKASPSFTRPILGVSSVQTIQQRFEGNLVPTLPHKLSPLIAITPSALTVKNVTIIAATNRPFNFATDRAGEFTVGCLRKNTPMITTKTTINKTIKGGKGKEHTADREMSVTGSYFDWREFTHDNKTSEQQQTLRNNYNATNNNNNTAVDQASIRGGMGRSELLEHETEQIAATNTTSARMEAMRKFTQSSVVGGGGTANSSNRLLGAGSNNNNNNGEIKYVYGTPAGGAPLGDAFLQQQMPPPPPPVSSAASAASFGFYNLTSVRYLGAGHEFVAFPFFTGDQLPLLPASKKQPSAQQQGLGAQENQEQKETRCVIAAWSPEGKVSLRTLE